MVCTGIDILIKNNFKALSDRHVGLLINQASVDRNLIPIIDHFVNCKSFAVKALFGPQHGISGTTQDNMIEWKSFYDAARKLPAYSLYGEVRKPTAPMLDGIDTMVIDLPDVGSRYYTFLWTALLTLQACGEKGIKVILLDRPNPLGGTTIEGPLLDEEYKSFVGLYPLVVRHGMTIGEIMTMIVDEQAISVDLQVVKLTGWRREMWFDESGLPWVMPSPNMPTLDSAIVYPGFCLLEGTNLSEGRGTTRPFELFGAPFIDPGVIVEDLRREALAGVVFRPACFEPTFQKHSGKVCGGAQMHVINRKKFSSLAAVAALLKAVQRRYPGHFRWKEPPYEYEYEKLPFDILAGGTRLRHHIEQDAPLSEITAEWKKDERAFRARRKKYLLYE